MSFKVKVQPSGHSFSVDSGERILDAALRQGVNFPYGCRSGFCGSCKGRVIEGDVVYPDGQPESLDDADASVGIAVFCQARTQNDLRIEIHEICSASEITVKRLPCRVEQMDKLAPDVMRLKLKFPDTERLPFLAGQYVDVILRDGRRRSFSIANPPHDDALTELHIRWVEGGDFTGHVFNTMKPKDILRIEGPLGNFYWRENLDRPLIFMAGGTGLAPIKAMIEHLIAEGTDQPMHLYWGVRARRDLYLPDLPLRWAQQLPNLKYIPVLSEAKPEDDWNGRTGFVHTAVAADFADLSAHAVYACGPPPMIDAGRAAFIAQGLPPEYFFYDAFDFQLPKPAG